MCTWLIHLKKLAMMKKKIDNRSSSVSAGVPGPERIAGDESKVPLTQALQDVESVCGSNTADFVASEGTICFGSEAVAAPRRCPATDPRSG